MKYVFRLLIVINLVLLSLLAGCVHHLTHEECLTKDWYEEGVKDGARGIHRTLKSEIKDCEKFGVTVNTSHYAEGWQQGVRQYCTPATGHALGIAGKHFPDFCPVDLKSEFHAAWYQGIRHYCVPEVGYELGRAGEPFPAVCPAEFNVAFRLAYDRGEALHEKEEELKSELNGIRDKLKRRESDLDSARREKKFSEEQGIKEDIYRLERDKRSLENRVDFVETR